MKYQAYAAEINNYKLACGFTVERAQNKEFIKNWVVYRRVNEDFTQGLEEMLSVLEGVDFCFWIMSKGVRVGGVVMLPNRIGDLFLIPPENDAHLILSCIMPLLEHWSNESKEISAQAIVSRYEGAFRRAGFKLIERRVWMIRPTERMTIDWPSEWSAANLDRSKTKEIATLLLSAFAGDVGSYGARDIGAHLRSVEDFFHKYDMDTVCGRASAQVVEKQSGKLLGVCMVNIHMKLPSIRMLAVDPSYQDQGIGTLLLKRAMDRLSLEYDWVKLAVTEGNPALTMYENLGFVSGDRMCQLSKPPSN